MSYRWDALLPCFLPCGAVRCMSQTLLDRCAVESGVSYEDTRGPALWLHKTYTTAATVRLGHGADYPG